VADKPVPMLRVPVQPLALDTIQANLVQTGLMASDQVGKCAPPLPSGASVPTAGAQGQLTVWTHEDPAVYNYLANLAADFADANSGVKIRLVNLDADPLQNKFQSSALSSDSPDLLLTTGDQGAKFVGSDLLQPVDDWVDPTQFLSVTVGSLSVDGRLYGVPVQAANYFVLYFNKKLIKDPPADTAALLRLAPTLTRSDAQQWTLLWNQSEADYVIPWLGGFKGRILADDGRTPTLTTQAMTDTLTLLKQFRDQKVIAPDSDGEMTDTGFRLGKAAMVINGDWALKDYQAALGDNLGVARIPQVTKTREYPHPYVSARYLMAPRRLSGDRLSIARAFARFLTSRPIQVEMAIKFDRLPALKDAAADTAITSDPQLKGLADEVSVGIAEPTRDLQCFLDAIAANVGSVMSGKTTAADATKAMQDRANSCQP
jgi:arabinogalactan oligomer/maltooligosaccharide transport system substrate-binding protein